MVKCSAHGGLLMEDVLGGEGLLYGKQQQTSKRVTPWADNSALYG